MHLFPGRASAVPLPLLISRRPLFCMCETMQDLPLEGSRKVFQDNAMEPQGSALWQVVAGDKSTLQKQLQKLINLKQFL